MEKITTSVITNVDNTISSDEAKLYVNNGRINAIGIPHKMIDSKANDEFNVNVSKTHYEKLIYICQFSSMLYSGQHAKPIYRVFWPNLFKFTEYF